MLPLVGMLLQRASLLLLLLRERFRFLRAELRMASRTCARSTGSLGPLRRLVRCSPDHLPSHEVSVTSNARQWAWCTSGRCTRHSLLQPRWASAVNVRVGASARATARLSKTRSAMRCTHETQQRAPVLPMAMQEVKKKALPYIMTGYCCYLRFLVWLFLMLVNF